MFKTSNAVIKYIKEKSISEVDLKYTDLLGRWHHLTVPANASVKKVIKEGEGIDASSHKGFASVEGSDAIIIPDIKTGFLDTGKNRKTLSFICDVCDCLKRKPISTSPRGIAKKAVKYLKKTGFADNLFASPEFEFHIFDRLSFDIGGYGSHFEVSSAEAPYDENNPVSFIKKDEGYHAEEPFDRLYEIRGKISKGLEEAGIPVKYHHHERGGPSQMEIEVYFKPLLATADHIMKAKYLIRVIAARFNKTAVFLPKPLNGVSGNGMHIHLYLAKNKKSVFFDKNGIEGLSKIALHFIGGILKHGRAITGFACASTNSYKRLTPGYEAPVFFSYSGANRSAAIRIPLYVTKPSEKRIEFRISDASANPYLLLSTLLLAGIDGIKNAVDPGKPANVDLYKNRPSGLKMIPESLEQALNSIDEDREFLNQGNVFNDNIIDKWLTIKGLEVKEVKETVSPIDYKLYFDL